jgi:ankyrin repeat protein
VTGTPKRPAFATSKLPARTDLEHLKNEAKQHLKTLHAHDPSARLADAQLQVARSYGFSGWRPLKSYVGALHSFGPQLIYAVCDADLQTVRTILETHPALVNASIDMPLRARPIDALTMRLIHLAIAKAKIEVLRFIIERGADLHVRNDEGRTPLLDCFELDHDDYAKILLDAGAKPDVCAAAAYGLSDQLEQILRNDPTTANDLSTGNSPLGWSVFGRQPRSATILFEHGAIVDRPPYDAHAWGPTSMVASTLVTPVLLQHGADPNWRDDNGNTPIHRVIMSRLTLDPAKFIQLLLDFGADPALRNRDGRTPLEEALLHSGKIAETYFPARPVGPKKLETTIEILRARQTHPT